MKKICAVILCFLMMISSCFAIDIDTDLLTGKINNDANTTEDEDVVNVDEDVITVENARKEFINIKVGNKKYLFNNEEYEFEVTPFMDGETLMVEAEKLVKHFGGTLVYDSLEKTYTAFNGYYQNIVFTVGNSECIAQKFPDRMKAAPQLVQDKLMVPAETLAYWFSYMSEWTEDKSEFSIFKNYVYDPSKLANPDTYEGRCYELLHFLATNLPNRFYEPKYAYPYYTARLMLGIDKEYAYEMIDRLLEYNNIADEYSFSIQSVFDGYLIAREHYTPELTQKMLKYLSGWNYDYLHYRAQNYELMVYGTGILIAENFPDFIDAAGHTAEEMIEFGKYNLQKYWDIPIKNTDENGPVYYAINLENYKMLADFCQDEEIRTKAKMLADWHILHMATDWNQGYWCGTSNRSKYLAGTITGPYAPSGTAATCYLYFGGDTPINMAGTEPYHTFYAAYNGRYKAPEEAIYLANKRDEAFMKKELSTITTPSLIYKTVFHSPSYSLANQYDTNCEGNSYFFKEQRRTILKWISDKPASTFAPMQENRIKPIDLSPNAFGYGENPYTQTLQNNGTVIAVVNVPFGYGHSRIYVPFTKLGAIKNRIEKDGWVFCDTGNMFFAFKIIKPYEWQKEKISYFSDEQLDYDILCSDYEKNGWIIETAEASKYGTGDNFFEQFIEDVLTNTEIDDSEIDDRRPRLKYKSISGDELEITFRNHVEAYINHCKINGQRINYSSFPNLETPWCYQEAEDSKLEIYMDDKTVVYDFDNWTITEK